MSDLARSFPTGYTAIFLSHTPEMTIPRHVMEHESFDNEAVAKILNQFFISIKVDREQHPDIDETYMTAITMMTGRGGWPMSSFITHEGKTFWGGTYFPAEQFKQ